MSFRKMYECICDYCGECNYHIYDKSGRSIKDLRSAGYLVTRNGIYCCKDCYNKAREKKKGGEEC